MTQKEQTALRHLRLEACERLSAAAEENYRKRVELANAENRPIEHAPEPEMPSVEDLIIAVRVIRYLVPHPADALLYSHLLGPRD